MANGDGPNIPNPGFPPFKDPTVKLIVEVLMWATAWLVWLIRQWQRQAAVKKAAAPPTQESGVD